MRLDSRTGIRGLVFDLDTGQPIRWVRWADTETGEYEAFRSDPAAAKRLGTPLARLVYRGRARLKFVPTHPAAKETAPGSGRATTPQTTARPGKAERCLVLSNRPCRHYGCKGSMYPSWG